MSRYTIVYLLSVKILWLLFENCTLFVSNNLAAVKVLQELCKCILAFLGEYQPIRNVVTSQIIPVISYVNYSVSCDLWEKKIAALVLYIIYI